MNNTNFYSQQPQSYAQLNRPVYAPQFALKGRPVASIEEARASIIDFDGSVFYFPDLANKRIYTKQINLDGTATLCMYELKEIPVVQEPNSSQYITREEFEAVINSLRASAQPVETRSASEPASIPIQEKTKLQLDF